MIATDTEAYAIRVATTQEEVFAAQRLRFEVFNLELNEGLVAAHFIGRDEDKFDAVCDHLVVEHEPTGGIVGTYRMQTGVVAAAGIGYYSETEFDFKPFEQFRGEMVELGRACIHRDHRHASVLTLLWRGIAAYARSRGAHFLVGCSSLTSQDCGLGVATLRYFETRGFLAEERFLTRPQPGYECASDATVADCPPPPKLLRAYLALGAKVCGPPALDREFGTIDFLTLLDLRAVSANVKARFGL